MTDLVQATTEPADERGGHPATMDAALKAKFVEALRSRKYTQNHGTLRHDDSFCCLGVLLDIQGAQWDMHGGAWLHGERVAPLTTPPSHTIGGISLDQANTLISMNDGTDGECRHSFPEIADHIEANL